jgi:hypothetical protein
VTTGGDGYLSGMVRRIREEIIDDDGVDYVPVRRGGRVVERHTSGAGYGAGYGLNPLAWVIAAVLVVFILLLAFGGLR